MKTLNQYIKEKLIINKDYRDNTIVVKSFDELRKIIKDRYNKLGPGTKKYPINFNDIDVSKIDSFYSSNTDIGIFEETGFKYIDISDWDVSNITSMRFMFYSCEELKSTGDISKWDVSNVTDMSGMFAYCNYFNENLSYWDVSNVTNMAYMFTGCSNLNQDISRWNVSLVTDMSYMFFGCENFNQNISSWDVSKVADMCSMFKFCRSFNQDLSKWNISKVKNNILMFENCPIKEEYKPKFK